MQLPLQLYPWHVSNTLDGQVSLGVGVGDPVVTHPDSLLGRPYWTGPGHVQEPWGPPIGHQALTSHPTPSHLGIANFLKTLHLSSFLIASVKAGALSLVRAFCSNVFFLIGAHFKSLVDLAKPSNIFDG